MRSAQLFLLVFAQTVLGVGCRHSNQDASVEAEGLGTVPVRTEAASEKPESLGPPPGTYIYWASCGPTDAWAYELTIGDGAHARFLYEGIMRIPANLTGRLRRVGDGQEFVVASSDSSTYEVGAVAFSVEKAPNGLIVRGLEPECGGTGPLFFVDKSKQAPAVRDSEPILRTSVCKGNAGSVRSGCICSGTSTIENPCKMGGGFPTVSGSTCTHQCAR